MSFKKLSISISGFTLIEIVTVIVVLGILSVFTFSFIDNAVKTYMIGSKQRMLYQEAAYAIDRISRELRDVISVTSGGNLLTIRKPDRSSNVSIMDPAQTVDFQQTGNDLLRNSIVVASHVTAFTPSGTCASGSTNCMVTVTLTVTDASIPLPANAQSVTMTTTVTPKNFQPAGAYTNRCFNGDYEDVVQ